MMAQPDSTDWLNYENLTRSTRDSHEASQLATCLVASKAEPGPETRAARQASVGRPALVHERGGSLALVSEASNDVASPRLASSASPFTA